MTPRQWLEKLAQFTSRTQDETRRIADVQSARAKFLLFFCVLSSLAMLYVPVLVDHFSSWISFRPEVAFSPDSWRVLYKTYPPCGNLAAKDLDCPADPDNPVLWDSFFLRSDPNHFTRARQRYLKDYWLGLTVPPELLAQARRYNATQLLLGNIVSHYRIYIDGEFITGATRARDTNPILITLPASKFLSGKPMYVAIQVIHNADVMLPDLLNAAAGGEGFVTHETANSYRNFMAFWEKVRPFSLLLSYAVLAGLFFFFWTSSKVKQEYFYMALFALIGAFYQARKMDILLASVSSEMNAFIEYVLRFYIATFGMFLGLAFSRTRRVFFTYGVPTSLGLPFLLYLSLPRFRFELYQSLHFWITPMLIGIGAGACFLQASYLHLHRRTGTSLPVRTRRMALFGIGLASLSVFYFIQSRDLLGAAIPMFWDGSEHFLFMIFMGMIALGEYANTEFLASKAPVSEYHRRPVLPERIAGAILIADLKDSEVFYRYRAANSQVENMVTVWRNHFYDIVYANNGIILNKKGDELLAFFDQDKSLFPLVNALHVIEEVATVSAAIESEFRRQRMLPAGSTGFYFRAALTVGDIRPVWENFGGNREAYWEEAGNTSPFVEANRLLDLERQVPNTTPTTQLMIREELANVACSQDRRINSKFEARDQLLIDKHGKRYQVAVFRPARLLAALPGMPGQKDEAA